jgi:hypothetical protein
LEGLKGGEDDGWGQLVAGEGVGDEGEDGSEDWDDCGKTTSRLQLWTRQAKRDVDQNDNLRAMTEVIEARAMQLILSFLSS